MSGILADLNESQRAAVTHGEGPLLILAGAGSGKTRVITRRVAYLLCERGVGPLSVLAITFTNKAAREMKERIHPWVPRRDLWVSTFHAMCARMLRRDAEAVGFGRDFTIYDTYDRDVLLREILRDQGLDTARFRPSQVGAAISAWKNRMVSPEEAAAGGSFADEAIARAYRRYGERMREQNALDFDDLLLLTLRLFDENPEIRRRYAERFEHLLIDEYQDTNRVQYLLARHLAGERRNLCCCGDPDQSIYRWRGAEIQNILDFERDFGSATVVKLEQNYRSTKTILAAAEAVIRHNRSRKEKTLWTENPEGEKLVLLPCADEEEEGREIAAQIRALRAAGRSYRDVAVFYRVNFLQRALEAGLREAVIPYQVVAGVEFFERKEIKDLLAYLRALVNPCDDLSLERVINVPPRGIGETTVQRVKDFAASRGVSLREALGRNAEIPELTARSRKGLEALAGLFSSWSELPQGGAGAALERVVADTRYVEHVGDLGGPSDLDRVENVEELRRYAEDYDRREPEGRLSGFLAEISLVADADRMEEGDDRVSLMTLHSAKGLEFPVVLISGCEEGLIPHARSMDEEKELEEERRLFYVGLTRARERLFLTYARSRIHYGAEMPQGSSRFLREIPERLFEREEREEPSAPQARGISGTELAEGDGVRHELFGEGKVFALQGSGVNARAIVDFPRFGRKILLLTYANLRKLEAAR